MKLTLMLWCFIFSLTLFSFGQNGEKLKIPGPEVQNLMLGKWSTLVKYAPTPEMPKAGEHDKLDFGVGRITISPPF